jgi:hypothetical protein
LNILKIILPFVHAQSLGMDGDPRQDTPRQCQELFENANQLEKRLGLVEEKIVDEKSLGLIASSQLNDALKRAKETDDYVSALEARIGILETLQDMDDYASALETPIANLEHRTDDCATASGTTDETPAVALASTLETRIGILENGQTPLQQQTKAVEQGKDDLVQQLRILKAQHDLRVPMQQHQELQLELRRVKDQQRANASERETLEQNVAKLQSDNERSKNAFSDLSLESEQLVRESMVLQAELAQLQESSVPRSELEELKNAKSLDANRQTMLDQLNEYKVMLQAHAAESSNKLQALAEENMQLREALESSDTVPRAELEKVKQELRSRGSPGAPSSPRAILPQRLVQPNLVSELVGLHAPRTVASNGVARSIVFSPPGSGKLPIARSFSQSFPTTTAQPQLRMKPVAMSSSQMSLHSIGTRRQ